MSMSYLTRDIGLSIRDHIEGSTVTQYDKRRIVVSATNSS